jgi:hypothetical protein
VLFRGAVRTGCGAGQAAMGPFYCPADQKVYIDLSFYETLKTAGRARRLRAGLRDRARGRPPRAAPAGHHRPRSTSARPQQPGAGQRDERAAGTAGRLLRRRLGAPRAEVRNILEQGDIEEAMNAAQKIGDDALQRSAGRAVVPESFTHGSSAQRQRWFNTG